MKNQSDIYLNTLCLAAWAPGPSTIKLAKAAVRTFEELSPEERTLITPLNMLYIKLIKDVIDGKLDLSNRAEAQNILAQYESDEAFKTNKADYVALKTMLLPDAAPSPTAVKRLVQRVKNKIIWQENSKRIRMLSLANAKAGYDDDPEKQQELLQRILDDAAEFAEIYNSQTSDDDDGPMDEIDFDNPATVTRGLVQQHKKRDGQTIKFGWQGVNEMFGPRKAACYGEAMAFAGASHCGKSLILQSLCISHLMFNKPPDVGRAKPLILFISLENEAHENLKQLYKTMYVNTYHKEPANMTDEEIVTYLTQAVNKNGFHFKIIRKHGDAFGYTEYAQMVDDYEKKQGYKVVATYLDYITLCRHERADMDKNDSKQIENMVKRFTDHSNEKNIFFCTAFQLDAEAARIKLSGQTNCVRRFNEATLSDCKAALKPLDLLFFNDIEVNHVGASYLCFAWRKHRYEENTPKEAKYCAYRFGPLGIPYDVNGTPQFTRDIYAEDGSTAEGPEQSVDIF